MLSKGAQNNAVQMEFVCMENVFVETITVEKVAASYQQLGLDQKWVYSYQKAITTVC